MLKSTLPNFYQSFVMQEKKIFNQTALTDEHVLYLLLVFLERETFIDAPLLRTARLYIARGLLTFSVSFQDL